LNKLLHPLFGYPVVALDFLRAIAQAPGWLGNSWAPATHDIPADFLGVNVAPAQDPAIDDFILQRLSELALRDLRMDFSYDSLNGPAQRLLERLLDAGYRVLLDVFPPLTEAEGLAEDPAAQLRWQQFLDEVFQRYGERIELFEIGNTPNRGRWSGFTGRTFLVAWDIALHSAASAGVRVAGPNVSDFEPLYNAAFLSFIRRLGRAPEVHTDNLFVERVIEPEAFDHRVLGRAATALLKLNLVKKARVLAQLGRQRGCSELVCTYTCWTSKRAARRSPWPAQKQADYMLRYLLLAAASGALRRVYWGPLICNRDGLIDDACPDYPVIDQVTYYQRVRGKAEDFSITPAFRTLANTARTLHGKRVTPLLHQPDGVSVFKLAADDNNIAFVLWCRDGQSYPLDRLFSASTLETASFQDSAGNNLPPQAVASERPLFIHFAATVTDPSDEPTADNIVHLATPAQQSIALADRQWTGALMLRRDKQAMDLAEGSQLSAQIIPTLPETRVLRDARNRLWNVADPRGRDGEITVKLNRVTGFKRLSYRFRPSKGRRHWNNACSMLGRGVATPLPVCFYERPDSPGIRDSWYLCEFIPDSFSARNVYAAFRDGATDYCGLDKAAWFDLLSGFVCHMHNRQIVHRDLSSGNLLLARNAAGDIVPMVIDIGRAWVWRGPGSRLRERHRLQDLIRIAYKLGWRDREAFMAAYEDHYGRAFSPLWRLPFHYYDNKQRLKKALKGKQKKTPKQ